MGSRNSGSTGHEPRASPQHSHSGLARRHARYNLLGWTLAALTCEFLGGIVLSDDLTEIIGIVGVLVFHQAIGIKLLSRLSWGDWRRGRALGEPVRRVPGLTGTDATENERAEGMMAHTDSAIPARTRPTPDVGIARYGRIAFISVTGLLLVAIAFQVFLAGMSIFAGATWWQVHMLTGSLIGILPIVLIGLALLGRLPRAFLLVSALLLGQVVLQFAFIEIGANAGAPWFAALHPVNALAIFMVSLMLFQRARRAV